MRGFIVMTIEEAIKICLNQKLPTAEAGGNGEKYYETHKE